MQVKLVALAALVAAAACAVDGKASVYSTAAGLGGTLREGPSTTQDACSAGDSAAWLVGRRWPLAWLVVAVLGVVLLACCIQMLLMQQQLRQIQLAVSTKPSCQPNSANLPGGETHRSTRDGSQPLGSCGSGACSQPAPLEVLPVADEPGQSMSSTSERGGDGSTQQQHATVEALPTTSQDECPASFPTPFLSEAYRHPLSPAASLSPRDSMRSINDSSRPPRHPGMEQRPPSAPNLLGTLLGCFPGEGCASQEGSIASVSCGQLGAHGSLPPSGADTPTLHSPYASGSIAPPSDKQMSALPELMQLVAAYQACNSTSTVATQPAPWWDVKNEEVTPVRLSTCSTMSDHVLLSGESLGLPMRLAQSLVDPSAVEYLHGPDGKLEKLGEGASSKVYKALYNGEVIAAKEIDVDGSPEMRESFVTEVLLLQQLRHPNVVGFFGLSLTARKGVVLLEYCEGKDLHSALQHTAPGNGERLFGWYKRGRRVAYEVAKALNFLHSKGVTHCDIKSSNILLTASGEARLSDVGLARHQAIVDSEARGMGTFAWMAPELLLDSDRGCTLSCDVYSYGVLLWEIITGERPLRGRLRVPKVPEECPQGVCDLTMRCMANNAAERPTAGKLLQELGGLLLKRAFAADRTTINLLGTKTGGVGADAGSPAGTAAVYDPKRISADGIPLRSQTLEPASAAGLRRSLSFNYQLLVAAGSGFNKPTAAESLAAVNVDSLDLAASLELDPGPAKLEEVDFNGLAAAVQLDPAPA